MGRPSEGWKIHRDPGRHVWSVHFSHAGKRYELGTSEEDADAASRRAAVIYAETVATGKAPKKRTGKRLDSRSLREVGTGWLGSLDGVLDHSTVDSYALYLNAHFVPYFETVERVTFGAFGNYIQKRLREVRASSVGKERGAMIGLLAFAFNVDRKLVELPEIPTRAVGKSHARGKRTRTPLSPQEAIDIVRALPAMRVIVVKERGTKRGSWCFKAFVRARVVLSYETSLRPKTLDHLSVPENFYYGSKTITIDSAIDKARFGRTVPISKRARRYLNWCLRKLGPDFTGPIFGKFRSRKAMRNAARSVGLSEAKVKTLHPYDLRAARLTHWAETGNLPAAAWLGGHKKISTTALYARGTERAAEDLINGRKVG